MTKPTKTPITGRFAVVLLFVVVIGVATGAGISTSGPAPFTGVIQSKNAGLPLVTSASSAVRVISVERNNIGESPVLEVSLQNISTKNIEAYSLGSGKRWVTRSYYFSEESFAPNTTEKQIIPLSVPGFSPSTELILTGVLFDDGTTDGEAIAVFRLKETHDGLRDQINRLLPCLRELPSTLTSQQEAALSRCESAASSLPIKGRSSDYEDGLQNAQRELLKQLGEIKSKVRSADFSNATRQRDKLIRIVQSLI